MAVDIIAALALTPEALAEKFPINNRPFAIWYNADAAAENLTRLWAVNNYGGGSCEEYDDMESALKAAAKNSKQFAIECADVARDQALTLAKLSSSGNNDPVADNPVDIVFGDVNTAKWNCMMLNPLLDNALQNALGNTGGNSEKRTGELIALLDASLNYSKKLMETISHIESFQFKLKAVAVL